MTLTLDQGTGPLRGTKVRGIDDVGELVDAGVVVRA